MSSGIKKTLIPTAVPLISPEKICPCFLSTNNCSGFTLKVKSCSLINWFRCFRYCYQDIYLAKCNINIHTLVYVPLFAGYYCHCIQTQPKLKSSKVQLSITCLCVGVFIKQSRCFLGEPLGKQHSTHAGTEFSPWEIE